MSGINIDRSSVVAIDSMRVNAREAQRVHSALSSGSRINSAMDDAAGLRISRVMTSHLKGMEVAIRNLHDGISLAQTAEGALSTLSDALQRMRELALQAINGTQDNTQRELLDTEYQQLRLQIADVVEDTTWNGHTLFNKLSSTSFELQAGPNSGDRITITIPQIYASGSLVSFQNGDFESDSIGSTSITGWTVVNSRVTLDGNSTIGGWPTPVDTTKPAASGGDALPSSSASYSTTIVATDNPDGDTKSLRMQSTGVTVTGYGIVHGPYIISNSAAELDAGATVSFEWKAQGGADAYDVYAYLLNVDTGATVKLLDQSGSSGAMTSSWTSVSTTVPTAGNYKFVFVSGTFDATGGTVAGARLFVDNIDAPPTEYPSLDSTSIATASAAGQAITQIDLEIASIDKARAALGSVMGRILHATDNLGQRSISTEQSRSRILDTDYAASTVLWSRAQLLNSAVTYALSQSRKNEAVTVDMIKSNDRLFRA
ncbi:MAG: hypothetical protein FJY42_13695 [Betaproteobacteria bacterium]|nr:hypothetical protein [Betaproteobacteria bacterium]